MRSVMQGYMERGRCEVNGHEVVSDAGVVFLGNIETDNMDEYKKSIRYDETESKRNPSNLAWL